MKTFGAPWEALELEQVHRFLNDRPDEGLTWEAKGGEIRPEQVRAAVCAFANSDLGGFLILGASRKKPDAEWSVGGWTPKDEPALWVENCLANGGVAPRPAIEVRPWPIDGGPEYLAVVAIQPIAIPPAITGAGEVWQRVSGSSQRVRDPAALRQLFERGRVAERRAEETSTSGLDWVVDFDLAKRPTAYALSVATPALPPDVSSRLFRASVADHVAEVLRGSLRGEALDPRFSREAIWVDRFGLSGTSSSAFGNGAEGFSLRLTRDGALAASRADPDLTGRGVDQTGRDPGQLVPLWLAVFEFAKELGAATGSPVILLIWLSDAERGPLTLKRWTDLAPLSDDQLASIAREARRAAGQPAWEV